MAARNGASQKHESVELRPTAYAATVEEEYGTVEITDASDDYPTGWVYLKRDNYDQWPCSVAELEVIIIAAKKVAGGN